MSEFQTVPASDTPVVRETPPSPKKESLLTRPLFFGQSLPWLAGGALVLGITAWYLFWPATSAPDPGQLAFGSDAGFSEMQPATAPPAISEVQPAAISPAAVPQTGGLSLPAESVSGTASMVPDEVVKIIRDGQAFEAANREAITRLLETVRAQSAALASLNQRLDSMASENSRQLNQLTALNSRQASSAGGHVSAGKGVKRSALSGMKLESVQDGMAWVSWQGRTWAVQSGDTLGSVTVRDINASERSVITSAGILR